MLFIKRPAFLTIWLVLLTIQRILVLFVPLILTVFDRQISTISLRFHLMLNFTTVVAIMDLVGISMLWRWKKLGFYIIGAILILEILDSIKSISANVNEEVVLLMPLVLLGQVILYLAMRPVWKNFK